MKSNRKKIQKNLTKGIALVILFILTFSFLSSFEVNFAETIVENSDEENVETNEQEEGQEDVGEETVSDDNFLVSEDTEHAIKELQRDISAYIKELANFNSGKVFDYEAFKEELINKEKIYISNEVELRALSIYVAEGNETDKKTFILKNNIGLTRSVEWCPIGSKTNPFKGTLDGAGYNISGILISVKQDAAGLIGYMEGAEVKNLTVTDSNISIPPEIDNANWNDIKSTYFVSYNYLGGIVGYAVTSTITNCHNKTAIEGGNYVGGIVGVMRAGNISDCTNSGTIKGYRDVGGISGIFKTEENKTEENEIKYVLSRCKNTGKVIGIALGVGGISGAAYRTVKIKKCLNEGEVILNKETLTVYVNGVQTTCSPRYVGGIVGFAVGNNENDKTIIEACINDENAKVEGYKEVGGIVGQLAGTGKGTSEASYCINYSNNINSTYLNTNKKKLEGGIAGGIGAKSGGKGIVYGGFYQPKFTEDDPNIINTAFKYAGYNNTKDSTSRIYKVNCKSNGEYNYYYAPVDTDKYPITFKEGEICYKDKPSEDDDTCDKIKSGVLHTFGYKEEEEEGKVIKRKGTALSGKITIDSEAPQMVESDHKLYINDQQITNAALAKKGDKITIKISFDEKININRIIPKLNLESLDEANFIGIGPDGKSLEFEYTVTGEEGKPKDKTYIISKVNFSVEAIKDVFENAEEGEFSFAANIKIIRNSAESIVLTHEGVDESKNKYKIIYTISGAKNDGNGNLYFNSEENSEITVTVDFEGDLTNSASKAEVPKLNLKLKTDENNYYEDKEITGEYEYDDDDDDNPKKIVYTILSEKYKDYNGAITDVYLTTEKSITINTEPSATATFNYANTGVTFANVFVDTIKPELELSASVNNKSESGKYTVGEDILITATTSEPIVVNQDKKPEINVSFSESGLGKYNYQGENATTGNAKYIETVKNKDNTVTYKYRYTIQPGDEGDISLNYIDTKFEIEDIAGNKKIEKLDNDLKISNIYVDTSAPTLVITRNPEENPTNANKITYTFTWSEEVEGFGAEDITVNNGTKGKLNKTDDRTYTMEITTNVENGNVGEVQVIVEQDACQDLIGKSNVKTESIIRVDKQAPILVSLEAYANSDLTVEESVDTVKQYYKSEDRVTVVATFSENIENSAAPELELHFSESGNAKGTVTPETILGNKITYTYTLTGEDNGTLSVKGFSGTVEDAAGNETVVTKRILDGDTIIADTDSPSLTELKVVSPDKGTYNEGNVITIEAIYDEEIYALEGNEIKLITNENAPELKLSFGGVEAKGTVEIKGYGETEGKEDKTKIKYQYTITAGDNGDLTITSYENKANINVCDISGNIATLGINKTGSQITADTTIPVVEEITATGTSEINNITHNNIGYYKSGSTIDVTVKSNEVIATDVIDVYYAFKDTEPTEEEYNKHLEGHINTDNAKEFNFKIQVQDGENGYLWVKINENVFMDVAQNGNMEKESIKLTNIYADTEDPYLATNSNSDSKWEIKYLTNTDGQVTKIEVVGMFNEEVFSMEGDTLVNLRDIPIVGVFVNNVLEKTTEDNSPVVNEVEGKTQLTYTIDITDIDTVGNISVNFIDGKVYDRAGNEMSIELVNGDVASPIFKDIKVITPNGFYKVGETIEIVARFEEETKLTTVPKLKIRLGEKIEELSGSYSAEDSENTDSLKVARYTYTIKVGDSGALNIVSLIGDVSDGVRTNKNLSQIYIDLNNDDVNDVNGKAEELLNNLGSVYANNNEEHKNVIADTTHPTLTITSDVQITNQDIITYTFTWSEIVSGFTAEDIEVINGSKVEFKQSTTDSKVYTLTVDSLEEGRQIVKVNAEACEDRAGNSNTERTVYNDVIIDFTKPILRAVINGGTFVIDTDSGKSTLKERIVSNEDLSKFEYCWSTVEDGQDGIPITDWQGDEKINLELEKEVAEGTYYLYIKATDLAGNTLEVRSKAFKVVNSQIIFEGIPAEGISTNKDVSVTVKYGEGLTENRKAGISGKTQSADSTKVIISENGTVYAEATDLVGNKVYKTQEITCIDKDAPKATITYTNNDDGTVTATVTFDEEGVTITNNDAKDTYVFTENGEFTFEFKDAAGNTGTAVAEVTTIVPEDNEAPTIAFDYTLSNITVGEPIGATILTNEDAIISYSWDNKQWTTSEDYITSVNATYTTTEVGTYTLYAKAEDRSENESEVQTLQFTVVNKVEDIKEPEIIFEDLPTIQVDGIKYVKVPEDMTAEILTSKMNKEALCGKTPEYIKLTQDGDLRTTSEITIEGKTKYIIVVRGDINCDGKVTFTDIIKTNGVRISRAEDSLLKAQLLAVDINNTGKIEFRDIISINAIRINSAS